MLTFIKQLMEEGSGLEDAEVFRRGTDGQQGRRTDGEHRGDRGKADAGWQRHGAMGVGRAWCRWWREADTRCAQADG